MWDRVNNMQKASSLFSVGQEKYLDHHDSDGHDI